MKRALSLLLFLVPMMAFAQVVTQQNTTPSSGTNQNHQAFGWANGIFNNNLGLPIGTNATLNNAIPREGYVYLQTSDTTFQVYHNGHFMPFGGGGSANSIYFSSVFFSGLGTFASPIGIIANSVFPTQTGNNGKFLTTDGTNTSWATSTGGVTSITPGFGFTSHTPITTTGTLTIDTSASVVGKLPNGDVYINGKLYPVKGFYSDSASIVTSHSTITALTLNQPNSGYLALQVNGGSAFNGLSEFQQYVQHDQTVDFEQSITFAAVSGIINGKGFEWYTDPSNHWGLQYSTADSALHYSKNNAPNSGNRVALVSDITGFGSGTVTSVATGTGLTGGTITTSGTVSADTAVLRTVANSRSLAQTQTALNLKANLASPTFTGTPAVPTAAPGTNTTQVASTAFVAAAVTAGTVSGANPTASVGVTAVNGSATTYMRSDAAPKADTAALQTIANFFPKGDTRYLKSATISGLANPTASIGFTAVNGSAITGTRSDGAPKADSTVIRSVANSYSLAGMQTKLNTLSAIYQPLEDQRLSTTNSPSFVKQSLTGTAGGGYLDLLSQSASPGTATNHLRLYSDSVNRLSWKNSTYRRTIQVPYPSDYTIRMPYLVTGTTLEDSTYSRATYLPLTTVSGLANPTGTIGLSAVNGSAISGMRSDGAPALSQAIVPTWTGVHTFSKTVNTTPADAIVVSTPTAAANGAQQYSPGVNIQGNGWGTTAGTSQAVNWRMYAIPVQSTVPSSNFMIDFSVNGGAYANRFQLGSNGAWSFNGGAGAGLGGSYTATVSNIAATSTDGIYSRNTQPATVGTPVQRSPRLRFTGTVWNTTATAATNQVDWTMEARGVSGTTPTSALWLSSSLVTGSTASYTDRFSFSDGGKLGLLNTPTTSAGTYDVLTRNTSTGEVEKVPSTNLSWITASNDLTGQTAANSSIATYTVGASNGTFRVGGYLTITAVVTDVINFQVTWTDETSTVRTQTYSPMGTTSPSISTTGAYPFAPIEIRAKTATAITVQTVLTTGIGSITYDVGGTIQQLR